MVNRSVRRCLAYAVVIVAAGCDPSPTPIVPTTSAASWREPDNYEYVLESYCGERLLTGHLKFIVDSGAVTRVVGLDEAGKRIAEEARPATMPTIKDLLDEYEAARRAGADVATVEYDSTDGHPTQIKLDPDRDAIDDEACYAISGYVTR